MPPKKLTFPDERIEKLIREFRGARVIVDADLARLYGVKTGALNQAVKRNAKRFPVDFVFPLSSVEAGEQGEALRSQFVTLKSGRGQHRK